MTWENGIAYTGAWANGVYHGRGSKTYSRGGGYEGMWRQGKRQGRGTTIYAGKWGYERWEGPFVDDRPHGEGVMHLAGTMQEAVPFSFAEGEPTTKLPDVDA